MSGALLNRALLIGINDYDCPDLMSLHGCVNDAKEIGASLETNEDGSPNFGIRYLVSSEERVTARLTYQLISELFSGDAETVLLYFAGHGFVDEKTNGGFLVTQDGDNPNWGIDLVKVLQYANSAHPRIKSTIIFLDCCQSGIAGKINGFGSTEDISYIGTGVTILCACQQDGYAKESGGHGLFTNLLLDGLNGAASDILGRITPASLYFHVDQTLGSWEQRPLYKANVKSFISVKNVQPKVSPKILRKLPMYFKTADSVYKLDPSFEPERGEEYENLKNIPIDEKNVQIYRELQQCNRHSLVEPTEHNHMWHSAVFSGGCRLTVTGKHYRQLAVRGRI